MSERDKITAGELLGGLIAVSDTYARKGLSGLLQDVVDAAVQWGRDNPDPETVTYVERTLGGKKISVTIRKEKKHGLD